MIQNLSWARMLYFAAIVVGAVAVGICFQTFVVVQSMRVFLSVVVPLSMIVLTIMGIASATIEKAFEEDNAEKGLLVLFAVGLVAEVVVWGSLFPVMILLGFGVWVGYWYLFAK